MKPVGEVLKRERERQHKTITDVSRETFIATEHIEAIERNAFHSLPSVACVQGFLTTYADILGMPRDSVLALLRRDYRVTGEDCIPIAQTTRVRTVRMRTVLSVLLGVATVVGVIGGYSYWSLARLQQPPDLRITTPEEGAMTRSPVIVRGRTDSDALVQVDGQGVAITQDGEFAIEQTLEPGKHTITVVAKNRTGKETVSQVTITVE